MKTITNADRLREFQQALYDKAMAAKDEDAAMLHALDQTWVHPDKIYLEEEDAYLADDILDLGIRLITEEFEETVQAALNEDREALLKELTDLKYVVERLVQVLGFDSTTAEVLVHENNMAKVINGVFKDGKLKKPADHPKPDLSGCV